MYLEKRKSKTAKIAYHMYVKRYNFRDAKTNNKLKKPTTKVSLIRVSR